MNNSKKKRMKRMVLQDTEGISRKTHKFEMNLSVFYAIKISLIALIIICYFVFSTALFFLLIAYALTFFLAIITEKTINKSFLKRNRLKIPKFDSALALIIVVTSIVVGLSGASTQTKRGAFDELNASQISSFVSSSRFEKAKEMVEQREIQEKFTNIFSLLTGERNVFGSVGMGKFNSAKPPENFTPPSSIDGEMPTPPEDFDISSFREGMGPRKSGMKMSDIPGYFIFSSMLSIVASILVLAVPCLGGLQILFTSIKKKKIENQTYTCVITESKLNFTDEQLEKLLSFGNEVLLPSDFVY